MKHSMPHDRAATWSCNARSVDVAGRRQDSYDRRPHLRDGDLSVHVATAVSGEAVSGPLGLLAITAVSFAADETAARLIATILGTNLSP